MPPMGRARPINGLDMSGEAGLKAVAVEEEGEVLAKAEGKDLVVTREVGGGGRRIWAVGSTSRLSSVLESCTTN
jgi:hypothetical protein